MYFNLNLLGIALIMLSSIISANNINNNNYQQSNYGFSLDLLNETLKSTPINENIVLSPFSIQTCLTLAYFGAQGKTFDELSKGLYLTNLKRDDIANNFQQLLQSNDVNSLMNIANHIYVQESNQINDEFHKFALEKFNSKIENIDFNNSNESAKKINQWIEEQTNNKIQNLIQPSTLENTNTLLVNAIYFKGQWEKPFSTLVTRKGQFWLDEQNSVEVDIMFNHDDFLYGELIELDAKFIELPYNNSKITMLVIVPNKKTGLHELEEKLNLIDLTEIDKHGDVFETTLEFPKFKNEFSLNLNEILKKMGMETMFTDAADFSKLTKTPIKVDKVQHKAVIEVNEHGTEAAGATYLKAVPLSLNLNEKFLSVDRPFLYFIRDKNAVYFTGRVTKF